ncbi:hypothetical protein TNIN_246871 [Trichonephila inaurata madagascariensis]|uniref:Uncharacterized protein n=1 Tax=Trichonephila inaurata madagascariensis TaxID=2747483 RepID=A0A8X6XKZ1_9ARAC|nr:hypothetical protein TNIN_246871 [Trichonephila inaurata madagascariensis]
MELAVSNVRGKIDSGADKSSSREACWAVVPNIFDARSPCSRESGGSEFLSDSNRGNRVPQVGHFHRCLAVKIGALSKMKHGKKNSEESELVQTIGEGTNVLSDIACVRCRESKRGDEKVS